MTKRLSELLKVRYKNIKPPASVVEKETKNIIREELQVPLLEFKVTYKSPVLVITTESSALKNEVFLRKERILEKLKNHLDLSPPPKIWFQ